MRGEQVRGIGDKGNVTWPSMHKHAQVSGKGNSGRCTAVRKECRTSRMHTVPKCVYSSSKAYLLQRHPWNHGGGTQKMTPAYVARGKHPQGILVQSGQVEKEEIRGISRAARGQEPVLLQAWSGWEALSMHSGTHSYSALRENSLHHKQSWAEPPQ